MTDHSFREQRITNAKNRFTKLVKAIREGDFSSWGEIIESEALELHAMMMTSSSSYLLMKPRTLEVIETVRRLRKKYSLDLFFTLDAGPNVHLLYPEKQKEIIVELIEKNITELRFIHDRVGSGPRESSVLGKKNFPSKILLFGEYTIIRNSKALAIPFEIFEGTLTFPKSGQEKGGAQ